MNKLKEIIKILKEKDCFLENNLFENEVNNFLLFINSLLMNLKDDLIIVAPSKKEISYLSSIYSCLNFFKKNYKDKLEHFENWLKPNTMVSLCASGKETGKVYKYIGPDKDKNYIDLETASDKNIIKIKHKIDTLLQITPSQNTKPLGKTGYLPKPQKTFLDYLISVNSFSNPILYDDKFVFVSESKKSYENFLIKQIFQININKIKENKNAKEIIKNNPIDDNGETYDKYRSLILYSRDLNHVYEHIKKDNREIIIISDQINKFNQNFSVLNQIKQINKNIKVLLLAEENEYEEILDFSKKNKTQVWRLSTDEIENLTDLSSNKAENKYSLIVNNKNKNFLKKDTIFINVKSTLFGEIYYTLNEVVQKLKKSNLEVDFKDELRELISPLFILMYRLRDKIFGFEEEDVEELNVAIANFKTNLSSKKTFLEEQIYNTLVELRILFAKLQINSNEIFFDRLNEFYKTIKEWQNDRQSSYAILVHNRKVKNYFIKHMQENLGFMPKIIDNFHSDEIYDKIIVPSELTNSQLETILTSYSYKSIFFIGEKSFKEKFNQIEKKLFMRWKKFLIDPEQKCNILNLESKFASYLNTSDLSKMNQVNEQADVETVDSYFKSDKYEIIRSKDKASESEEVLIDAFLVIFNGDSYAYLTENFDTEIFNDYFDNESEQKRNIIISKTWKDISKGDILFLRAGSDKDILSAESILILGDETKYKELKNKTKKISEIINNSFKNDLNQKTLRIYLEKVGYNKLTQNVISIAEPDSGTLCPTDINDLKKIFKACEIKNSTKSDSTKYVYSDKECEDIFRAAQEIKKIHIKAGRSITTKLKKLIKEKSAELSFEYDGMPLRIDYENNNLTIGSESSQNPEGWLVQVNSIRVPRTLEKVKPSMLNRVLFI